jgi:hypothetical protein
LEHAPGRVFGSHVSVFRFESPRLSQFWCSLRLVQRTMNLLRAR